MENVTRFVGLDYHLDSVRDEPSNAVDPRVRENLRKQP